jgi:hypothetical protein
MFSDAISRARRRHRGNARRKNRAAANHIFPGRFGREPGASMIGRQWRAT